MCADKFCTSLCCNCPKLFCCLYHGGCASCFWCLSMECCDEHCFITFITSMSHRHPFDVCFLGGSDALSSQAFMTLAARYPRQACSHGDRTPEDGLSGDSPAQGSNQLCDHSSSTSTSLGSSQTCALLDSKVHAPADPATDAESLQPGGIPMPGSLPELAVGLQQSSTSASAEPPREADRPSYQDIVDWEAVMAAPAEALADAIKCRGFHNNLSLRIQVVCGPAGYVCNTSQAACAVLVLHCRSLLCSGCKLWGNSSCLPCKAACKHALRC